MRCAMRSAWRLGFKSNAWRHLQRVLVPPAPHELFPSKKVISTPSKSWFQQYRNGDFARRRTVWIKIIGKFEAK